jgi:hypothetical protein
MPKAKKMGRPKLPKGHAKGRIVPVRLKDEDVKAATRAAKAAGHKTLSSWIRYRLTHGEFERYMWGILDKAKAGETLNDAERKHLFALAEFSLASLFESGPDTQVAIGGLTIGDIRRARRLKEKLRK